MAVIAGNIRTRVFAQVPGGEVFGFSMAGQAFRRLRLRIGDLLAEDEYPYPAFTAFLHVGRSGAMTALASILTGRAIGDVFLGMGRYGIGLKMVLVAAFADLHPDNPIASPAFFGG